MYTDTYNHGSGQPILNHAKNKFSPTSPSNTAETTVTAPQCPNRWHSGPVRHRGGSSDSVGPNNEYHITSLTNPGFDGCIEISIWLG